MVFVKIRYDIPAWYCVHATTAWMTFPTSLLGDLQSFNKWRTYSDPSNALIGKILIPSSSEGPWHISYAVFWLKPHFQTIGNNFFLTFYICFSDKNDWGRVCCYFMIIYYNDDSCYLFYDHGVYTNVLHSQD